MPHEPHNLPPHTDADKPAFPQHAATGNVEHWRHGMSLRDWFAGQALAGIISNPDVLTAPPDMIAKVAYDIADAMVKAGA